MQRAYSAYREERLCALTLHSYSHAVKNTSQSKEETDNTPSEKTEQVLLVSGPSAFKLSNF